MTLKGYHNSIEVKPIITRSLSKDNSGYAMITAA